MTSTRFIPGEHVYHIVLAKRPGCTHFIDDQDASLSAGFVAAASKFLGRTRFLPLVASVI